MKNEKYYIRSNSNYPVNPLHNNGMSLHNVDFRNEKLNPKLLIGLKFGKWTVLKHLGFKKSYVTTNNKTKKKIIVRSRHYLCECVCGHRQSITLGNLRSGKTKGCFGCSAGNFKHGFTKHPLYQTYIGMLNRCNNPHESNYKNYGGRGIKVCDRWLNSFEFFVKDMGEKPSHKYSIDRINNNGDYEPSNCRWATPIEQAQNKRTIIELEHGHNGRKLDDLDYRTDISRERKRQIRKNRLGRCYRCNQKMAKGGLCMEHLKIKRDNCRKYYLLKKSA